MTNKPYLQLANRQPGVKEHDPNDYTYGTLLIAYDNGIWFRDRIDTEHGTGACWTCITARYVRITKAFYGEVIDPATTRVEIMIIEREEKEDA